MKNFSLITKNPVPSCVVNRIIWDPENKSWEYEYHVRIPDDVYILEDGRFSKELFIYGHMQELLLVDRVTKNSINIKIQNKQQMIDVLRLQYEEDMKYRRKWIKNNPDYYDNVHHTVVKNETQKSKYKHIIFIKEQLEDETVFIVAPQKGVD